MGATGYHYDFGFPFPSLYVKHGNMGDGGRLREGFIFIRDGSPPSASGVRTGWFLHPELIGISLDLGLCLAVVYGFTFVGKKILKTED
jgi:hypothetical protein